MKMTNWRLGFYCFCLVAIFTATQAVNTIPTPAKRKVASRGLASDVKIAVDKAIEEEVLIITPFGAIYKRTRYVESVRIHVSDNQNLLKEIKKKDLALKKKIAEIEDLKSKNQTAAKVISVAINELQKMKTEREQLESRLIATKRLHQQEKQKLEEDISKLEESIASEKNQKDSEKRLKLAALAELQKEKINFLTVQEQLNETSGELNTAKEDLVILNERVAALSTELEGKQTKIDEQTQKLTQQESQISKQTDSLAALKVAECNQQEQLKELKKQVEAFESEKSDMDEVIALLKKEKEETAKQRVTEKKQIEALMQQFTMYAMLMSQQPQQQQMPTVGHNPLTDSSLVNWDQYMMLSMMGNMSRQGGASPFDFNGGNSQVNSYYYAPQRQTDAFLYNSAINPTGTSWGNITPESYFGDYGQGFGAPLDRPLSAISGPSQGFNFGGSVSGSRVPAAKGFFAF
jgi:predicted  nucleic acid-binding Zn-ribbon protein